MFKTRSLLNLATQSLSLSLILFMGSLVFAVISSLSVFVLGAFFLNAREKRTNNKRSFSEENAEYVRQRASEHSLAESIKQKIVEVEKDRD